MTTANESAWSEILSKLQGQMTTATFNALINGTTATTDIANNSLTIHPKSAYAQDWIEHRLHTTIHRAVTTTIGSDIKIFYEVKNDPDPERKPPEPEPEPGGFSVELISFNPTEFGFVQTSRYSLIFWQPLLGHSFHVWITLRAFAWNKKTESWPSIEVLADTCTNGNRHRLLGRNERNNRKAQVGALEILTEAKIIHVRIQGEGRKTQYFFRVLDNLPLLTPHQVKHLTPELQKRHKRWLWECSISYEEWQQLNFKSLLESEMS